MDIDWAFLFSPAILDALLHGLGVTVVVSAYSAVGAIVIGFVIALFQVSVHRPLKSIGQLYVNFFRNIPLLVQLFFWYFGLPELLPPREFPLLYGGRYEITVATLTLSLAWGAFVAEVVRAGIEAVPFGQVEAAMASGLSRPQVFRRIVMPQLGPVILPGLSNELINIVKSTSLAMTVGVSELTWQAQQIESETFRGFEAMTAVTVIYLALSLTVAGGVRVLERLLRLP